MIPSLGSLIKGVSPANALTNILTIAADLGLSTTSWGPLGAILTILETIATVVSEGSVEVSLIAQGGYASTAAAMVDSNGNPIATWMDLVGLDNYDAIRNPAVPASGLVAFSNITNVPRGPFAAGAVHLRHPVTGATYSNTVAGEQIYGTGTPPTPFYSVMHFAADAAWSGASGTMTGGIVPALTTPYPGVSAVALGLHGSSPALVGTDAEVNAAFLARCRAKLQAIAPNGANGALVYVATTPGLVALWGVVSAPITRARRYLDVASGVVYLYLANADGPALTGDAAVVQLAETALAQPTGMNLVCVSAINASIVVAALIYTTNFAPGQDSLAASATAAYFASLSIGGTNLAVEGVVPISGILNAIQEALPPGVTGINLAAPTTNAVLPSPDAVPTLDPSSTFTIVRVPAP